MIKPATMSKEFAQALAMSPAELARETQKARRELYAHQRMLAAVEARDDILKLCAVTMPDFTRTEDPTATIYKVRPHHKVIADAFEQVLAGKLLKVIITVPPQFGKSALCKRLLAQHVGKFPFRHLIYATYNQTFAEENGGEVRDILQSDAYQLAYPKVKLAKGSKARDHMAIEGFGGKLAFAGRGGTVAGRPADGLIFDDFFKGHEEADSLTIRDAVWNFLTTVVLPRCHMHAWQIIVSTRWSHDDPVARLIDPKNPYYREAVAKQWTVINIPAIVENEHMAKALGLKVGEALWADRFGLEHLATLKATNERGFSALFMGRPTPPEGDFFKRDQIHGYTIDELPENGTNYLAGDFAVSETSTADKTCAGDWTVGPDDTLYLRPDILWDRVNSGKWVEWLIDTAKRTDALTLFAEKGVIDKAVGPFLAKRMREREKSFYVNALPSAGNKGQCAAAIRDRMAMGKVKFPKFASWWPRAEEAILKFGEEGGPDDDFVDMLGCIGRGLTKQLIGRENDAPKNVVRPKSGTRAWFRWVREHEKRDEKKSKALAGW